MTGDFFLTQWFFLGMRWLCENLLNNSIFLTILISTLLLRLITLPSDISQRKTSAKMAKIQPQLAGIQERYKNDPQRMQAESQKLMRENGVNSMFSGCLPLLITIPLLFCFIAAFRFWGYEQNVKILVEMNTNYAVAEANPVYDDKGELVVSVSETFLQGKFLWINNIWQADNGFSPVMSTSDSFYSKASYDSTKKLIYFNEHPDVYAELVRMGLFYDAVEGYSDMTADEKTAAKDAAVAQYNKLTAPLNKHYEGHNNGWFILPLLATLLQLLYMVYTTKQQKIQQQANTSVTTKKAADAPNMGMGKTMLYIMPIMSFIFCLQYTAAFALYWTLSSFFMLVINIAVTAVFNAKNNAAAAN